MRPQPVSFKKWLNKYRPRVEALELRNMPAISVTQVGAVLTINGTASAETVHVFDFGEDSGGIGVIDEGRAGVEGDEREFGPFFDVETIKINMKGGADVLTYDVMAQLRGETRHITANLGGEGDTRNNSFDFDTNGNTLIGVDISLDIIGGGKSDTINVTFDDILPKNEFVSGSGGSGGSGGFEFEHSTIEIDGTLFTGIDPTKVKFLGDIESTDIEVDFNLGAGDNDFLIQFGGVGGGIETVSHQDYISGGSIIDVEIIGSNSATNKDNVKANFASELGSVGAEGSNTLNYDVFLGAGKQDFATVNIDLDTFGVGEFEDFFGSGAGDFVHIGLNGEAGNDVLKVTSRDEFGFRSTGPAYIGPNSTLEIILKGGAGTDTTNVDLIGAEDTASGGSTDQVGQPGGFEVDGTLRVHTFGGSGNDSATVSLQIAAGSTGELDAKVKGEGDNDHLILSIIDNSGASGDGDISPTIIGPEDADSLTYTDGAGLIDGGTGFDSFGRFGNVIVINCEFPGQDEGSGGSQP